MPKAQTTSAAANEPTLRRSAPTTVRKPRVKAAPSSALEFDLAARQGEIAKVAYLKWLQRGDGPGNAEDDWLQAEIEVRAEFTPGKA